jgi:Na+/H+ antiporter NhaC
MKQMDVKTSSRSLNYFGGPVGAVTPFVVFVIGVVVIALSGAPDERGFWPVLILALVLGLFLSRDRKAFSETVIEGMSQPIVMIMISAWMMASVIGILMQDTGFVEALIWVAGRLHLEGAAFILAGFIICCVVSVSTGTSFGTILICGPILYPAGVMVGAPPATLAGAILGGATFGDCIAPISDTTIASALSQEADIGGTVRSRLKYVLPAAGVVLLVYILIALTKSAEIHDEVFQSAGSPRGLPMILVPLAIIFLLLWGRHLLEGLMSGLLLGVVLGLALGLLQPARILSLDIAHFKVNSFIIDGIDRAVGISFFTILLMGLVATLTASGVLQKVVDFSLKKSRTIKSAEAWIAGSVSAAVLLTCHSIVAILTVGEFSRLIGEKKGIHRYRRANLLSLSVSIYPFILPYFIPVILMANTTVSGTAYGIPPVSPLQTGLHNFFSWAVLLVLIVALAFGYGRFSDAKVGSPPVLSK